MRVGVDTLVGDEVAQGLRAIGLNAGSAECCRLSASLMAFGCGSALGFRPGYPSSARLSVGEQPSRSGEPKARPIADSKGREEGREEKREEGREEKREEGREEKREEGREERREEGREERREEGRGWGCSRRIRSAIFW
jgi:hypothetical protein